MLLPRRHRPRICAGAWQSGTHGDGDHRPHFQQNGDRHSERHSVADDHQLGYSQSEPIGHQFRDAVHTPDVHTVSDGNVHVHAYGLSYPERNPN